MHVCARTRTRTHLYTCVVHKDSIVSGNLYLLQIEIEDPVSQEWDSDMDHLSPSILSEP